jgi:predicted AAA+ superfamily ATPase
MIFDEVQYVYDTGLACALLRISSPETLGAYPNLEALFETFVHNQIKAASTMLGVAPQIYHWRSNGGAEVDLVLERDGWFYPIEIKLRSYQENNRSYTSEVVSAIIWRK